LRDELEGLRARRDPGTVLISHEAHLVLPHHKKNDEGGGFVGTTGRGIGPCYSDKARRLGLRFGDLLDDATLRDRLGRLLEGKPNSTARVGWTDVDVAMDALADMRAYVAPMVTDTGEVVRAALRAGQRVLFEGGQGTMLDLSYGTYPFVTSSHPTVGGILVGAGVSHKALTSVVGVVKAFTTRVGHGPFRTEVAGETASRLRGTGEQPVGRVRHHHRPPAPGGLARPAAAALRRRHQRLRRPGGHQARRALGPRRDAGVRRRRRARRARLPRMPGWGDLRGLGSRDALPQPVLDYLALMEDVVGVPVVMFSTSPDREDTYGAVRWARLTPSGRELYQKRERDEVARARARPGTAAPNLTRMVLLRSIDRAARQRPPNSSAALAIGTNFL
jgi:adenylosuccinate synthase